MMKLEVSRDRVW